MLISTNYSNNDSLFQDLKYDKREFILTITKKGRYEMFSSPHTVN